MSFFKFDGCYRRSWNLHGGVAALCAAGFLGACSASPDLSNEARDARPDARQVDVALTPVPDEELRRMRGGLKIGALDIDFGVQVQVIVNNALAATTQMKLNDKGGMDVVSQDIVDPTPGGAGNPVVAKLLHDDLNGAGPSNGNGLQGVTISGNNGMAQAVFKAGLDNITNVVTNTIPGFKIEQHITSNLSINNFSALRDMLMGAAAKNAIAKAGAMDRLLGVGP